MSASSINKDKDMDAPLSHSLTFIDTGGKDSNDSSECDDDKPKRLEPERTNHTTRLDDGETRNTSLIASSSSPPDTRGQP